MIPIRFEEANTTYTGEGCGDLPAWHGFDINQKFRIISCWRMTWRERLKALVTGRLWLDIWSTSLPPVALLSDKPFRRKMP